MECQRKKNIADQLNSHPSSFPTPHPQSLPARSDAARCSDSLWSHLWTVQKRRKKSRSNPATAALLIFQLKSWTHSAAWPCWHLPWLHLFTSGSGDQFSKSLGSVVKPCCDSCPSTQRRRNIPGFTLSDYVCLTICFPEPVYDWASLFCFTHFHYY